MVKPEFSYHIVKDLEGGEVFWWPISGFGSYCTDEAQARKNYSEQVQSDPNGIYKLVRYTAVYRGKNVTGIVTGSQLVLAETPSVEMSAV